MKFELTICPYVAGVAQPKSQTTTVEFGDSFRDAVMKLYSRPDFNPEYRLIDAKLVPPPSVPSDKSV